MVRPRFSSLNGRCTDHLRTSSRDLTATFTIANDFRTLREVHRVTMELYESLKGVRDMDFIFSYVPLPSVVTRQSLARGGDVLGLNRKPRDRICECVLRLIFSLE